VGTGNGTILRSFSDYADVRVAAYVKGSGLSDAQDLLVYNRLVTYLTAIGAN
jgi:hypothetical protein